MLNWVDDACFEIDGQRYLVTVGSSQLMTVAPTDDSLVLGKSRELVCTYVHRFGGRDDTRRIVELGVYRGGSCAFLYQLCKPDRIVAIDIDTAPVIALERFVARRGLENSIRPFYGVDQADQERLIAIVEREFAGESLDLVVDDASHLYQESRASFEVLFPRLRAGGRYLIEGWNWAHYPGAPWQERGGPFPDEPALTNLVVELIMVVGSRPDVIAELRVEHGMVEVVRGTGRLEVPVELRSLYRNRGNRFRPLL